MATLRVAPVVAGAPAERANDRDREHAADDPVERPEQTSHCRLQMRDGDETRLDDDRDRRYPNDSNEMSAICRFHHVTE